MKKPEDILCEPKYSELSHLVLTCEAMEDYARDVSIVALAQAQKQIEAERKETINLLTRIQSADLLLTPRIRAEINNYVTKLLKL